MSGKITPTSIYGQARAPAVHADTISATVGIAPYDGNIAAPSEGAVGSESLLGGLDGNELPINPSPKIDSGIEAVAVQTQRKIGGSIASSAELERVREGLEVLKREREAEQSRAKKLEEDIAAKQSELRSSLSKCEELDEKIEIESKLVLAYTEDGKGETAMAADVERGGEDDGRRNNSLPKSPKKESTYKAVTEARPEITGGGVTHTNAALDYDADNEDNLVESSPPPSPLKESKHSVLPLSPSRKLRDVTEGTAENTEDEYTYDANLPFMGYNDADHDKDYGRSFSPSPSPRAHIRSPQVAQLNSDDEDDDDKVAKYFLKGKMRRLVT